MRFTILQQDLMPALQSVVRCSGVRSQLPVLANILLQTDHGKLKLSATNLEIGVIRSINAEIVEDGEVTVPAKTLVDVISNLVGEKVEVYATIDQMEISTTSFSSKINGISAAEFPVIPLTGKEAVGVSPEVILKSLPQVAFASAVDDGRPVLTGILTEIKDKKLQLVATDGYKLAHKTADLDRESTFKALIPRRTFEEIVRLIGEEEIDLIKISTSDDQNQMIFELGNTKLSSRLIEGQFPSWEKIIPAQYKLRMVGERGEILKAVKLAAVFSKNEANIVKMQISTHKLTLTSEAKELGSQQKEVKVESEGEALEIAFNARFLQDILSAFNSSQVIFEFSGSLSACRIKPMGEEGLEYIIMPVNLT